MVILDEPDAHLDAHGRGALARAIAAHKARGSAAAIVAHHSATFAECDVVYRMEGGTLQPMAPPEDPSRASGTVASRDAPAGPVRAVRVVLPFRDFPEREPER